MSESHSLVSDEDAYDELAKLANEFENESDRAVAVLGGAKLDNLLAQLIAARLLPCTAKDDDLLDGDRPLSTFSARISMGYRLGLISPELAQALHLVRRIRNDFAHEHTGINLSNGAHRDRVFSLVLPMRDNWAFNWLLDDIFKKDRSPSSLFRAAIALMATRLAGALDNTERLPSEDSWDLLPPDREEDSAQPEDDAPLGEGTV